MRLRDILPKIPASYDSLGKANIETIKKMGFIRLPSYNTSNIEIYRIGKQYFYVDLKVCYLNAGAFGSVYVAFPIDLGTKKINTKQPVALKRFEHDEDHEQQFENIRIENKNLQRLINQVGDVGIAKKLSIKDRSLKPVCYFFSMEYFDGSPLVDNDEELNPELNDLSFCQIISLICEGAESLNRLHKKLNDDAQIIIHSDVKPENFLLAFIKENKIVNINSQNKEMVTVRPKLVLIDVGLAVSLENPILSNIEQCGGSAHTAAPETLEKKIGPKSDIYSYAAVIGTLFRKLVYLSKLDSINDYFLPNLPYDFSGLLNNFQDPETGLIPELEKLNIEMEDQHLITKLLVSFVTQMGDQIYEKRPNTESVLLFFTTLNEYLQSYQLASSLNNNQPTELLAERHFYLAQLILLTDDLWKTESNILKTIPNPLPAANARQFGKPSITKNYLISELDFHQQPVLCEQIIAAYREQKLNINLISENYVIKSAPKPQSSTCLIC